MSHFQQRANRTNEQNSERDAKTNPANEPARLSRWSFRDFRTALGRSFLTLHGGIENLPDIIEVAPLHSIFCDLLKRQAMHRGEIGRMGYISDADSQFVMGNEIAVGQEGSVGIRYYAEFPWQNRSIRPAVSFHTHPPRPASWEHHFSPEDFQSFLSSKELRASIVICEKAALMMAKTPSSNLGLSEKQIARQMSELTSEILGRNTSREAVKLFTKVACLQFGLKLYLIPTLNEGVAKRVVITSSVE